MPITGSCGRAASGLKAVTMSEVKRLRAECRRLQAMIDGHRVVHELIAAEAPLEEILQTLVLGVQDQSDGMSGSVLLYDPVELRLFHCVAPDLPAEYCAAIDGVVAGPNVGSCGTAAFFGHDVFVENIATDPRWADYRQLAAAHDLRACWSVPIIDPCGDVLATFALYCDRPRGPLASEVALIRHASRLAGIAIQRYRAQEWLDRLATHDSLTGLPNRVLLRDRIERMLTDRRRPDASVAAVFCDVNGLKTVNDSLGHDAGDRVLEAIAERLGRCVRAEDTVARFGSDEFVVAAAGMSTEEMSRLADRLVRALGAPMEGFEGRSNWSVSVTIGIAEARDDTRPQELIRRAGAAMQKAKRAGASWMFYEEGQQAPEVNELRVHSALHGALERDELSVVYQPILETATSQIIGVEALVRWTHPELGRVGPDEFIPVAEKHGLISAIGDWVLRQAARQATTFTAAAGREISVAVNVSPRQLVDPAFADRVQAILLEAGLAPALLSIEITETALMADDPATVINLRQLNELGVRLSLDDFGTGYSSLSHLRRLPISAVKIDRSFIDGLATDRDDSAIVSGVIGMARGLDLKIVAEGVETQAQAQALRTLACDFVQGYLFARPMPAAQVSELVSAQRRAAPNGRERPGVMTSPTRRAALAR
jgi:diguanylate cyclase (GGDEF)-like protein